MRHFFAILVLLFFGVWLHSTVRTVGRDGWYAEVEIGKETLDSYNL